ncbi:MAG TPA: hypothetical protein VIT44_03235, partial [Cyclobacteriaceae bacterium]
MKKTSFFIAAGLSVALVMAFTFRSTHSSYGLTTGSPEIKSITSLTFGPDGILFLGDSKSATVFAMDTKDAGKVEKGATVEIKNIDQKIAALLGTEASNVTITDIAVNPISKKVYCAVQSSDGTPVLLSIEGD